RSSCWMLVVMVRGGVGSPPDYPAATARARAADAAASQVRGCFEDAEQFCLPDRLPKVFDAGLHQHSFGRHVDHHILTMMSVEIRHAPVGLDVPHECLVTSAPSGRIADAHLLIPFAPVSTLVYPGFANDLRIA